ncbi:MAG TPA: hypothetical protein VEO54_03420 [Thermoanaerobaculia bacterium]|nr:hypothetical protein [Thermoanaerobaculia bacterium]
MLIFAQFALMFIPIVSMFVPFALILFRIVLMFALPSRSFAQLMLAVAHSE